MNLNQRIPEYFVIMNNFHQGKVEQRGRSGVSDPLIW